MVGPQAILRRSARVARGSLNLRLIERGAPTARPARSLWDGQQLQRAAVCEAVTSAIDTGTGNYLTDALVVVRIGATSPFYLATNRRVGVMGVIYLLNSEPTLLASLTGT